MHKASISLTDEHQLPERQGREERAPQGTWKSPPRGPTLQGNMKYLLVLSIPRGWDPVIKGHIGKVWTQLNMIKMSAGNTHLRI